GILLSREGARFGRVRDHRADLCLRHDMTIDSRLTVEPPYASPAAELADMIVELIARHYRPAELRLVDPHEIDDLRIVILAEARDAKRAGRLCQSLDDQHAGHDRKLRKVPLEERLVDRDVLDADAALVAVH